MPGSSAVPALPPPDDWRDRSRRIVGRRDRRYSALLPSLGPRRRGPRRDAPLLAHRPRSLRQWRLVQQLSGSPLQWHRPPQTAKGDAPRLAIVEPAPAAAVAGDIVLCARVADRKFAQIGRAACRERVEVSV